jgi:hypothetical protein
LALGGPENIDRSVIRFLVAEVRPAGEIFMRRAGVFAVGILFLGCHSYVPTTAPEAPLGSEVRALLSTEAQLALEDRLGMERRSVTGRMVERRADTLFLLVRTAGAGSGSLYQRLDIAERDVLRLDLRRQHNGRTFGLVVGLVGAATALTILLTGDVDSGSPLPGEPSPPERVTGWWSSVPRQR